jgi:hypothetical protein
MNSKLNNPSGKGRFSTCGLQIVGFTNHLRPRQCMKSYLHVLREDWCQYDMLGNIYSYGIMKCDFKFYHHMCNHRSGNLF